MVRKLATILCADIAGYSRLIGVDEEGALAAVKSQRGEVNDPIRASRNFRHFLILLNARLLGSRFRSDVATH